MSDELLSQEAEQEEGFDSPEIEEEELDRSQLSFGFSKRHRVLLDNAVTPAIVYHTADTELSAFSEVRRFLSLPFSTSEVENDKFEQLLTDAFQRDTSAAKQLMEDIGNESDLFSLAEELPETEDLLESEDDAPIIKLINVMLGEAIKEGASDIHV